METRIFRTRGELGKRLGGKPSEDGWIILPDERILLPQQLGTQVVMLAHGSTHTGGDKLAELINKFYLIVGLYRISRSVASRCATCARVNANPVQVKGSGTWWRGEEPGEHWELDFTEMPAAPGGSKYLLVMVDTFSGWAEAFPTRKETSQVVVKQLVFEIIPRFGLPYSLGSDSGPAFIAKVTQQLAETLKIK